MSSIYFKFELDDGRFIKQKKAVRDIQYYFLIYYYKFNTFAKTLNILKMIC